MVRLNLLDIILLLFFIYQGYRGYKNGFVKTIAPLIYWLAAFVAAVSLMGRVGGLLTQFLGFNGQIAPLVGFLFVLVFAMFFFRMVMEWIDGVFTHEKSKVLKPNSFVGMILGVFKGLLIASIVLLIISRLNILNAEMRSTSMFYGDVSSFVHTIWNRMAIFSPRMEALTEKFKMDLQKDNTATEPAATPTPQPDGAAK